MRSLIQVLSEVLQSGDRGTAAQIAQNTSATAAELSMHINGRRQLSAQKLVEVVNYLLEKGTLSVRVEL